MGRVDARRIVASMADIQTIRNRAVMKLVGIAMCKYHFPANSKFAIPFATNKHSCPGPTSIRTAGLVNVFPEPLLWRLPITAMTGYIAVIRLTGNQGKMATPALTEMRAIKAKLDRFWYTSHVITSMLGIGHPPTVQPVRGLFSIAIIP